MNNLNEKTQKLLMQNIKDYLLLKASTAPSEITTATIAEIETSLRQYNAITVLDALAQLNKSGVFTCR